MVGPYQLAKTIGAGSMGKVKVALDIRTNKRPASHASCGFLQPRERFTTKDRERRENKDIRIVREVAINRLLHHPNICVLHDVIVHPNHYYIFQELVSGGQMLDYIISHGRL
ncbi:Pkinase-domain-containing protein, partial [Linderina pennispora]